MNVVGSFLGFPRPPELRLRPHAVPALIDKTLELVGHHLVEKDIRLVRVDAPDLPTVTVDADQIKQVFINLLSNAVEALEEGGRLELEPADGPWLDCERLISLPCVLNLLGCVESMPKQNAEGQMRLAR